MPVMLFLLYVIVEVTALVWVGSAIGVLATVGLLVVGSVLGAMLLRREGSRTLGALRAALASGRRPEREVADGLLVALGGLLLVVPGLVTGVLGILLLLPPVRVLARPLLIGAAARKLVVVPAGFGRTAFRGRVVEGEVVDPVTRPDAATGTPRVLEGEIVDRP